MSAIVFFVPQRAQAQAPSSENPRLVNSHTSLLFHAKEGYRITQIEHARSGHVFLSEADGPLWELTWQRQDGTVLSLTADAKSQRSAELRRDGATQVLRLRWVGLQLGTDTADVAVEVTLADGDRLSFWNLETSWGDQTLELWDLRFPIVSGIARGSADDMLVMPTHWGRYCRDPIERLRGYGMVYPCSGSMQFWSFLSRGKGLYLASHDGDCWYKGWNWRADPKSDKGRWEATHSAPVPTPTPHRYCLPYPVVIGTFEGSWHEAATIYRRWAVQQPWCGEGPIATRKSIPEQFKQSACWLKYYFEPGKVLDELWDHQQYLRVPMAVHYYRYPVSRFDDNYPEFLPAKPGFMRAVADMQRLGAQVVPYTQGSIWDTDTQSWRLEAGPEAAARQQDGSLYEWPIHENIHAWMCPATKIWQNKVFDFTGKLVWDHGVDGVYLDVLSAGYARPCYNPAHGHPLHGGRYWGQGNRQLVDSLRRRIRSRKPDAVFTTEEICEIYLDKFDGFLTLDVTRGGYIPPVMLLPLFTAVYHDYAIQYGSDCALGSEPELFCPLLAEHFVWGAKLTLSEIRPPEIGQSPVSAAYLRELTRCYHSVGRPFLLEGQWLEPPPLDVPKQTVRLVRKRKVDVPMPVVRRSLWRAPDGSVGLVLTNWTDKPVDVDLKLEPARYGLDGSLLLQTLWPTAESRARPVDGEISIDVDLPAYSARVYRLAARAESIERPSYDEAPPYLCLRRTADKGFPTANVPPGSLWFSPGAVVSISTEGKLVVEELRSQNDFVLLRRHDARLVEPVDTVTESRDHSEMVVAFARGPVTLEVGPNYFLVARGPSGEVPVRYTDGQATAELDQSGGRVWITRPVFDGEALTDNLHCDKQHLAETSRRTVARWELLAAPQASLPAREAALDEEASLSSAVSAVCGMQLEIVVPPRTRVLPFEPLQFDVRLRRVAGKDQVRWESVSVQAIVDEHHDALQLTPVAGQDAGTMADDEHSIALKTLRLSVADRRLAEHAALLRAQVSVGHGNRSMVLTDHVRLPIDHPLLTNLVDRRVAIAGGRSRNIQLRIRSVAARGLAVTCVGRPPAGWRVEPAEGITESMPAAGDEPSEAIVEFTVTAPAEAPHGEVGVPFSILYEGHQQAERIDVLHCQVMPRLVPRRPAESTVTAADTLPRIRRSAHAIVYVEPDESAELVLEQLPVSQYVESTVYRLLDPALRPVASGKLGLGKQTTLRIPPGEAGSYVVELEPKQGSCVLRTDHRWLVWEASPQQPLSLFNDCPPQYFYVPSGAKRFSLVIQSGGPTETSRQTIWRPDGAVAIDDEGAYDSRRFTVEVPEEMAGKVWKLHVEPQQDVDFHLEGDVVPFVANDPARLLVPR